MSINTNIYGTSDTWPQDPDVDESAPAEQKYYFANFGSSTSYDISTLKAGIDNARIALNTPIDKSLSWCGLGKKSAFSKLEFYNDKIGDEFKMINKDSRTITNFALFTKAFPWTLANPAVSSWYYADKGTSHYGSRARWSPNAQDGTTSTTGNFNMGLKPVVQLPMRNCVFVPVLNVRKRVDTISSDDVNAQTVYMWDYLNTNNSVNYTTHPYITEVKMYCYGTLNGLTATSTNKRVIAFSPFGGCILAVTDNISAGKGLPFDMDVPSAIQGESTHYYAFGGSTNSLNIFGMRSTNSDYMVLSDSPTAYNYQATGYIVLPHPDGQISTPTSSDNYTRKLYYVQYYDGFKEWVREQIACFGMFFTDDKDTAETGDFDSELMCLGTLVDGVGNGKYTHGAANRDQPQWDWSTTNDSDYDPSNPPAIDPNDYDGAMRTHDLSILDTATQRYALSPTAMVGLLDKLWDIMALADPDQALTDYAVGEFLATNPIDCIVSLQFVPVAGINTGTETSVKLGRHDTQIPCQTAKLSLKVDCGNYEIFPRFGNSWIDRQTKITLYLPFCGTINLDPEVYMGRTINVEYLIDLSNGTCTAIVSFVGDGGLKVITDTASGCCAMDLPVTGIQQQTLNSQLFNATESVKQLKVNNAFKGFNSILNGAMSLGSNNPANAITGILGAGQDLYNIFQSEKIADYNLQHTMIPTKMIGTSGGLTGAMLEYYPTIIFERPSLPDGFDLLGRSEQYAHSEGYACCISGSLSEFTGYTEILNVDLAGFDATITEKNMIRSVLAGGVYL